MKQCEFKFNYEYKVYQGYEHVYTGKATRNILPWMRNIKLFDKNGNEVASLRQESKIKFFLRFIPLVNWLKVAVCPFNFYEDNNNIGFIKENINGDGYLLGNINDDKFEIWQHSGNNISIICNDKQVGLITRNASKVGDGDTYRVLINKKFNDVVAIMLTLLSDVLWNTSDTNATSMSWSYTFELTGKKLDREWKPED